MNPNQKREGREAAPPMVVDSPSRRRRMRAPGVRGLLSVAGALAVGISIAVLAAGGSYAYLNVTVPTSASGTISAGSSSLTLKRGADPATSALTLPAAQKMLPGDVVSHTLTLANPGNVPQSITAVVSDDGAWETRIGLGACAGPLGTTALSAAPVSFMTLAAGASQTVCVQIALPANAPVTAMNTGLGYTVTLDGKQVAA